MEKGLRLNRNPFSVVQLRISTLAMDHAWIELEHGVACLQQKQHNMPGTFSFYQFHKMDYCRCIK